MTSNLMHIMGMDIDPSLVKNPVLRKILDDIRKSNRTNIYSEHSKWGYSDYHDEYSDHHKYSEYREHDDYSVYSDYTLYSIHDNGRYHTDEYSSKDREENKLCYIATAALGTPYAPEIDNIRRVRNHLRDHSLLFKIVSEEYKRTAPGIAEKVRNNIYLKKLALEFLVKPLNDFSTAYQTKDIKEGLLKYATSLPFVVPFLGYLLISNVFSSLRKREMPKDSV